MMLSFDFDSEMSAKIKVVGVGGAGGNAVNRMVESGFSGVDFVAVNTDAQALECSLAHRTVQIGTKLTHGLGSGGNPEVGRKAVEENAEAVADAIGGADMVFVAAGMGGGTGTGASPIVARMARKAGALVVAVATKPFLFEGQYRMRQAVEGLEALKAEVDTAIVIPNQRLLAVASKNTPIREAFRIADDVLLRATKGVSDLITVPGLVNLDFADVRSVMTGMGDAVMGTGLSNGKNRSVEAAQQAISSPLLEDASIAGAEGVLVNVTGGSDLTLHEINEAALVINEAIGAETNMIFGAVIDDAMKDQVMITVIATGIRGPKKAAVERKPERRPERKPERTPVPATRLRPRSPESGQPVIHRRREPAVPANEGYVAEDAPAPAPGSRVVCAPKARRSGRRDMEIPTFLRRQMD
jgi:cell division protein FtsZ